jgi:hypothetical protein
VSFPYSSTFWKEKKPRKLSRAEIYRQITTGQLCDDLELLPLEQIALEASRTFKNTSQHDDIVSWVYEGALHQILIKPQYFQYGLMPVSENCMQGARFESTKLPALAGKFGCLMYHPEPELSLERPVGSIILKPLKLKAPGNQNASDSPATQLPASILQGPERIYEADTVATIRKTIEELESATGLIFEDDIDDLDYYKLAIIQIDNEKYFLQRHLNEQPGVMVAITTTCTSPGDAIDSLLVAFDMTSSDLSWHHNSVHFTPHELWRQDDNGNQVLIETCPCRADALQKARIFTERGHRQLYWAQRVK